MRKLGLFGAATLILAGVAVRLAHSQDAETEPKLIRGPAITVDAKGQYAVEVAVAAAVKDVTLIATVAGQSVTAPFAAVEGEPRLRAAFPELPSSAKVAYEVRAGSERLAHAELKTLPARGSKKLVFCALGDSGMPARGVDAPTLEQLSVAKLLARLDPDLAIHTGDVVYITGQESGIGPLFFEPYAATLGRVPFFACLGNHDVKTKNGNPELTELPHPANQNGNRYYSFDAANVHFVCLDSNEPMEAAGPDDFARSPQGKWLAADLAAATADWKIAYFHHPLYSALPKRAAEYERMQRSCEALLEQGGVDLCVCGHDHFYHRTGRLLAGQPDDHGIAHVVTGGGGAGLYPEEAQSFTAAHARRYHLTRFEVDGDRIKLTALSPTKSGEPETIDTAELTSKHGKTTH